MYYRTCPRCGCNLDPGEECECGKIKLERASRNAEFYNRFLTVKNSSGQLAFALDEQEGGMLGA